MPPNDTSPFPYDLPPGTTLADIDARDPDELRESTLRRTEPERFGLCVECMRETGREVRALNHLPLCETCAAEKVADPEAVVDLLRDLDKHGARPEDTGRILRLVWALVGDARAVAAK